MLPVFDANQPADIVEQYLRAIRNGDSCTIDEFLASYPCHDPSIKDALSAIQVLEDAMSMRAETPVAALLALQGFQGTERFAIIGRLGAGGMGAVYDALDRNTKARVALKLLPRVTPKALSRFKKEFRSFVELADSRFVALYELYAEGDRWFFTMERIDGVSLKTWLSRRNYCASSGGSRFYSRRRGNCIDAEQIRKTFADLALAISSLHQHGRIHRDLKFSNVMVRSNGSIVLIDFGLSSLLREQTDDMDSIPHGQLELESGKGSGSLQFMSPEQVNKQTLTSACDWYAFGAMLYEAISGEPPFQGTLEEVLYAKRSSGPPDPRHKFASVPDDLCELSMQLMQQDPCKRPSAGEIMRCLAATAATPLNIRGVHGIVGRRRELAILHKSLNDTLATGKQVTLHIHGDGGIGKTALLQSFLHSNGKTNLLFAKCRQQESIPFKAIDGIVDDLCRLLQRQDRQLQSRQDQADLTALAMLFPVLKAAVQSGNSCVSSVAPEEAWEIRRRAILAFRRIVGRLAQEGPLIIAIDDLHWGDADSAEFLLSLSESPISEPVLLILTYRNSHDTTPCVSAVKNEHANTQKICLGPLQPGEAKSLALANLPEVAGNEQLAFMAAIESRGNPLFLLQYAAHVSDCDTGQKSFFSIEDVIWARSRRLEPSALEVLEIVCVAGTWLLIDDLVAVRGDDASTRHHLAVLRSEHFVITNDTRAQCTIEPFHDCVVDVIRQRTKNERLAEASRKLALAISGRQDARLDLIAVLFEQAGETAQAYTFNIMAGRAAREAFAFEQAAKHFANAYRLGELTNVNTQASVAELADALADAGQSARAGETYLKAADWGSFENSFELRRSAATQFSICGQVDRSKSLFREILRCYRIRLPPKSSVLGMVQLFWQRARLRMRGLDFTKRPNDSPSVHGAEKVETVWSIAKCMSTTNTLAAASLHSLALRYALDLGDPSLISRCMAWEAVCQGTCGGKLLARGYSMLARAEELVMSCPDELSKGMARLSHGALLLHEFRFQAAIPLLDSAETHFLAYRRGAWWELGTVRWLRTVSRWHSGQLREMLRDTVKYSGEARRREDDYTLSNMLAVMHPYLCLMQDRSGDAQNARLEACGVWGHSGFHFQHLALLWSDLQWLLYNRMPLEAHNKCEQQWRSVKRSFILSNQLIRTMCLDLRATCAIAAASQALKKSHALSIAVNMAQLITQDKHVATVAFQQRILGGVLKCREGSRMR